MLKSFQSSHLLPSIGNLWIVAAPSGGGKTTLVEAAVAALPNLIRAVSYTTRTKRPNEIDGRDYFFVNATRFQALLDAGEMLENEEVFGNHYGSSLSFINQALSQGIDVVLTIDWQGAHYVKSILPTVKSVFILPPNIETLAVRLNQRNQDSDSVVNARMNEAKQQISHYREFDYVIINDDFSVALTDLMTCIAAERLKREPQQLRHADLIARLLRESNQ